METLEKKTQKEAFQSEEIYYQTAYEIWEAQYLAYSDIDLHY
ncbi:hypothetical protein [Gloeothece verrucosa]|nr:hypothetical protein [Gloeothece verrucosa]